MGKNWARGLTQATDARVARAAAGHRGLKYQRTALSNAGPRPEDRRCRWPRIAIPTCEDDWSPELAYAIGLLATDGGLGGRKTVVLVSKDHDQVVTFRQCVGAQHPIRRNSRAYRVQVTDVRFYRWLESIGVTARKSLTLGALAVPDHLLLHAVRGLLDGDGSIYTGMTTPNRRRYPGHTYQRLTVRFHSASLKHIEWLRGRLGTTLGLKGWVTVKKPKNERHSPLWVLRYSKHESIRLLTELYLDPNSPRLHRKWKKWVDYRDNGKPTRKWTNQRMADAR